MKISMKGIFAPALLGATLAVAGMAGVAHAERIIIPLGQQGDHWNVERPRTGLSKAAVEAKYGEPISKRGPVGDPAIYTWVYPTFNVIFEDDYVIHSVVKFEPKAQAEGE